jgi:hypothetical protein
MSKYAFYDFIPVDRDMMARGGSDSWRSYTDVNGVFGVPGNEVIYDDGSKDKFSGRPLGKAFTINQQHYKLQAREGQRDVQGKALKDYFMNAPFCYGSPNGTYTDSEGHRLLPDDIKDRRKNIERLIAGEIKQLNVKIKQLESEMDAEFALEAGANRAKAQLSVFEIDEETLTQIGALIGEFGLSEKMLRHRVYEFAGKRPTDYFKHLNTGDRPVRALVKKGLTDNILTQKGSIIFWKETVLGNDENAAVATLMGDAKMLDALSQQVDFKLKKAKPKK